MGTDGAFFSAPDDAAAREAESRPGGPLGWPHVTGRRRTGLLRSEPVVTELGPAHDGFAARGYDGAVTMGTLEELLTGRSYDAVTRDERWGRPPGPEDPDGPDGPDGPDDHGVLTLTDALRDALADVSDARLADVAAAWARTEELQVVGRDDVADAEHLVFLRQLRDLARRARRDGRHLYWYFAV